MGLPAALIYHFIYHFIYHVKYYIFTMVYTMVYIIVYMGYIMPANSYHGTRTGATPQKNIFFCEKPRNSSKYWAIHWAEGVF